MKKIVSLILAGLMSVSLFAIGASADRVVGDPDGVTPDKWTDTTTNGSDINVMVEKIVHKYAVDITFSLKDLTLGEISWDVNNMKYTVSKGDLTENKTQSIKLENRSDLAVYAYATVTPTADTTSSGLTVAANHTENNKLEILKASLPEAGETTGKATEGTLNITIKANNDDWDAIANYFANKKITEEDYKNFAELTDAASGAKAKSYKIATITVTISKNA